MKPDVRLFFVTLLLTYFVVELPGQGVRKAFEENWGGLRRQEVPPVVRVPPAKLIERLESQLSAQFTSEIAKTATATIWRGEAQVARGTIISRKSGLLNYLICPADAVCQGKWKARAVHGKPVDVKRSLKISQPDNLAIFQIDGVAGAISLPTSSQPAVDATGTFVGFIGNDRDWKIGAITNPRRTALTEEDPRLMGALRKHWERIELKVSKRRTGFPEVIDTDLAMEPTEAGSPVFDREGNWRGVAIARADQHSSYLIAAERVVSLIP